MIFLPKTSIRGEGSPIIQNGKLVGAVTHVILLCGASDAAWCYALCLS